ncbi:DNA glycosylase AlkZ-like family protein [Streptomyces parvus]|uniref:DNA glycosylase AlkZ-like family protein n=1 Tax=Streptomyces parvus TaxID=66428 RepID=UPI00355922B3
MRSFPGLAGLVDVPLDTGRTPPWPSAYADEAKANFVTAFLRAFGPATVDDAQWWTIWKRPPLRLTSSA